MINWKTTANNNLSGEITVPGDKSISHRSIILGAISEGITEISGFLEGQDCIATKHAFMQMGVKITQEDQKIIIHGAGKEGLTASKTPIDVGNSGTGMRLLAGLLSGQPFATTLIGDESLMKRPMRRITDPLSEMGANIATKNGTAPILISKSNKPLTGICYQQSVASAQVKSAILLASLYANGSTTIKEPGISRDHTEKMLEAFGCHIQKTTKDEQQITTMDCNQSLTAQSIDIPSDISSAAFFIIAASIAPKGQVVIKKVGINETRIGVLDILKLMNADIRITNQKLLGKEPVADIIIKPSELRGIEVPKHLVPLAIDEFPAIFIAAACAKGTFTLHHAKELRVKECDRIDVMAKGLKSLGVNCDTFEDGIQITGNPVTPFSGGEIDSFDDHRIAMAFAVAGLRSPSILIKNCKNVATSFPNFIELSSQLGLLIDEQHSN